MKIPAAPARWWHREGDRVICELCPRHCRLKDGQSGFCGVRRNVGRELISLSYGHPTGLAVDPIEKKPLFHFLPASPILSFGTIGCTLGCRFCQNWRLSRAEVDDRTGQTVTPQQIVDLAVKERSPAIAYTYNEPTVFAEYLTEIAALGRARGLRNVMVTNGYISPGARDEVFADIDGANVDLKAFDENFYRRETLSSLAPVLDTLAWIKKETDVWLEITTLLIPGLNDSPEQIGAECDWISEHLGIDVPLHLTAFHPDYQMQNRPRTPPATLARAREIARGKGLRYVYMGNVSDPEGQSTSCPSCGATVIARSWHDTRTAGLADGCCGACGTAIAGLWPPKSRGL